MSRRAKKTNIATIEKNPTIVRIEALMEARNWSLYRLAQESDLPYSSLSNLFNRNTEPTLPTLRRICYGLQIPLSDFFSDEVILPKQEYDADEIQLINEYRKLETAEQQLLNAYLHGLRRIKFKPGA